MFVPLIGSSLFHKENKNTIYFMLLAVCGLFILGCYPNERVYYNNGVACSASNRRSNEWRYYSIELGTPDFPYNGSPSIDIHTPDLIEFTSDSITTNDILDIKNKSVLGMIAIENTPNVGKWHESAKQILCGSYLSFVIEKDKVLQIKISNGGKFRVNGTEHWFELPCSENAIVEVFGNPERTFEWFRE